MLRRSIYASPPLVGSWVCAHFFESTGNSRLYEQHLTR